MAYSLGDMAKASDLFKGAADVSRMAPSEAVNDDATYNTAFTALAVKDYARAEEYYNKCLANNYTSDGNIYASLSEIADEFGRISVFAAVLSSSPSSISAYAT